MRPAQPTSLSRTRKGFGPMNRRNFINTTQTTVAAITAAKSNLFAAEEDKPIRTALIGCGWYGKTDLFHLNQVAPIDVVGLCDVDRKTVENAAELVAGRQPSKKRPPTY